MIGVEQRWGVGERRIKGGFYKFVHMVAIPDKEKIWKKIGWVGWRIRSSRHVTFEI